MSPSYDLDYAKSCFSNFAIACTSIFTTPKTPSAAQPKNTNP